MSRPQKIRTAKAFTYSKAESEEILRTLNRAGFPRENANDYLHAITSLARSALAAQPRPPADQVREEIRRVGKQAAQLATSLDALSPQARLFLDSYLRNDGDPLLSALSPHRLRGLIVRIVEQANLAAGGAAAHGPFRREGRPKEEPTRSFVLALCALYFTATGRLPRRQIGSDGIPRGPLHAFIKAALEPIRLLYSDHSVDHLIREARQVLEFGAPRFRHMAKSRQLPR